ncbi:hypothetical protein [Aquihabitans sp. McL0605]|uniref:hypothetical protein n=1 Tax=Aquihabitans sp. McL0605 TaxID=3415671 RepID=UPI003CEAA314
MSGSAGVSFKAPTTLSRRARLAVAVGVAAVVVVGAVLVVQAGSADGSGYPGQAWRTDLLAPRGAALDPFDREGTPGEVTGFGTWQAVGGGWTVTDGVLESYAAAPSALHVGTSTDQVVVYAQVVAAMPGGGITIGAAGAGPDAVGLQLVVDAAGTGWQLERVASDGRVVLATFEAPTRHVAVQLARVGTKATVTFEHLERTVAIPAGDQVGHSVGVVATSPGTAFDLLGYLPLAEG